jgi:RNA polymerase sigma-32 factor
VDPRRDPGIHPALLVAGEDGHHGAQKKLFFNLRRLKGQMQAIDDGDLRPSRSSQDRDHLGVPEQDVVSMNRRLAAPDHS